MALLIGMADGRLECQHSSPGENMNNESPSRVMTVEEVRAAFLTYVASIVDYWETEARAGSVRNRLEGVAFSLLVALDGEAMMLPGFRVTPQPHESDEAFHRAEGTNWFPNDVDIAGNLHGALSGYFKGQT